MEGVNLTRLKINLKSFFCIEYTKVKLNLTKVQKNTFKYIEFKYLSKCSFIEKP